MTSVASLTHPSKQGFLVKQGGLVRNWKRRWCVLHDSKLYYFKGKSDKEPAGVIPLLGARVELADHVTKKAHSLEVRTASRQYFMFTEGGREDLLEWKEAIERAAGRKPSFKQQQSSESMVVTVKGMMCERCAKRVNTIINKLAGVQSVELDIEEEQATIVGSVDVKELFNSLEEAGFLPAEQMVAA